MSTGSHQEGQLHVTYPSRNRYAISTSPQGEVGGVAGLTGSGLLRHDPPLLDFGEGDARQELAGVGVLRGGEDSRGVALFDELAGRKHGDAVAKHTDDREV